MSISTTQLLSDPAFVDALAFALAAELAIPLRGDANLAAVMQRNYVQAINGAAALSLSEGFEKTPDCSFLSVRNG